ncbi:potassium channel family protein [Herbiconiux moechotypicola]|uniref:Potassium channel family protein n=1 Tax=Herbiconiux moechotypicola TaxID=637393 RepID=A0ABN3DHD9_9MICO|nr:potassium channel family protein [Herbiconiux moechotypicola]MCS5729625.1 potassium channel family protein [Herbiconiux moechotypicola]
MTQARWKQLTEWPLAIIAFVFLVAYAWEIIGELEGPAERALDTVIWITWLVFVVDYLVNLALAERRWHWFWRHILDLLIVVLPMLRPLRLLRLVTLLTILNRTAGSAFRGRVVVYVVGASMLLVFVASLAVLDTERDAPGATIVTIGDALWWAFVTITTVGYGDYTPVTTEGRIIAVGLMLSGIALLGVVTATIASWIVERVAERDEDERAATRREVRALGEQIARLQATLEKKGA